MSDLKQNLVRARSHIVFLFGLGLAFALVIMLESWKVEPPVDEVERAAQLALSDDNPGLPAPTPLEPIERKWAEIAWSYFENNYQPETGLVNSVDNYPSATLWDLGSYLLGMISAHRLNIIDDATFHTRTDKLLESLGKMELFNGQLPNKVYHSQSLAMVEYDNSATDRGIGWSALDIGRFMVPLNVLVWHYPEFTPAARAVVDRWDMNAMLQDEQLMGARLNGDAAELVQEGRLGYEEYAAKAVSLSGRDVSNAMSYINNLHMIDIYGVSIATDSRDPEEFDAHNYVVTEPYVLDGIEFGWDKFSRELAWRVLKVQEKRYLDTGVLTAVSEDNINQPPHFVYNTIFTDGEVWNTITEDGEDASEFRTLSTKAAFGLHILFNTEYTSKLIHRLHDNYDAERGWYSGVYEIDDTPNDIITANTNGIMLETLAFKQFGPMLEYRPASNSTQIAQSEE